MIKSWTHDQNMVLVKNNNYWDKNNIKLNEINLDMVKDPNTQAQNFDSGQYDVINVTGDYVQKYKDKVKYFPNDMTYFLSFNNQDPIFKNANIRKAFGIAVDRNTLTKEVLKNGSLPAYALVPDGIPGYKTDFRKEVGAKLFSDNPKDAKASLEKGMKELNITKLPPITFLTSDSPTSKKEAQALQQFWQTNLGVNVQIDAISDKIRWDRFSKGQYQICESTWGPDYNDPMTFMDLWVTGGGNNGAKYSNPEYDKLIKEAEDSNDNKLRMEDMGKAEKLLFKDMPISPLYYSMTAYVQRSYVKGWVRHSVGVYNEWKWVYIQK